ncbi:LapA family protein [Acaricomes phytoseiuli]|uniref:LapA family protein n=1 Tax=Acaricomes phytoseiuli TaxID=291968 RepID=UPI000372C97A|nr:LapA family protein [Acaricomes phytoseiuli]MCW1250416.1 LapA family protein [Acaricomes phytoseiuli]
MQKNSAEKSSKRSLPAWLRPRVILSVLLLVVALVFVITNQGIGEVQLLLWTVTMPMWALTLSMLILGALIGWLFSWVRGRGD